MISDDARRFLEITVQAMLKQVGSQWKQGFSYAPVSDEEAEKMLGKKKRSVARLVTGESFP